jgi:hypothetical protein
MLRASTTDATGFPRPPVCCRGVRGGYTPPGYQPRSTGRAEDAEGPSTGGEAGDERKNLLHQAKTPLHPDNRDAVCRTVSGLRL